MLIKQKSGILLTGTKPVTKEVFFLNRKYFAGSLVLMACLLAVSGAYAFGGQFGGFQGSEEAKQALENNDYDAFIQSVSPDITEEQFERMAEVHEQRQAVEQALESGDYEAWVQAIESMPKITDLITEENFQDFAALHQARQNGDLETAKDLSEQLGLEQFQFQKGFRSTPHPGMRGGMNGIPPCGQWQEEGS